MATSYSPSDFEIFTDRVVTPSMYKYATSVGGSRPKAIQSYFGMSAIIRMCLHEQSVAEYTSRIKELEEKETAAIDVVIGPSTFDDSDDHLGVLGCDSPIHSEVMAFMRSLVRKYRAEINVLAMEMEIEMNYFSI